MSPDDLLGQAQNRTDLTNLIFEKFSKRFNQCETELFRQTADVVMKFDVCSSTSVPMTGFDHVGVEGSLGKEFRVGNTECFALESFDEFFADDFPLLLRDR